MPVERSEHMHVPALIVAGINTDDASMVSTLQVFD